MISLITGIPGSGKSYRAVYEINEILQKNEKNFLIVSNIEGLNIEDNRLIHQDIDSKDFFYKDSFQQYVNGLREKYRLCVSDMIYFYIDEPQRFLPPRLADENVFASFEMHRHYGVDIFLITQDKRKIPLPISCLAENEIRAVNPKFSIVPNCFNYNHFCGDYITGKSVLKKDKNVFKLYQSFLGGMPKKYTNSYVLILFGLILCLIAFMYFFIGSFSAEEKSSPSASKSSTVPAASAALSRPAPGPSSLAAASPVEAATDVTTATTEPLEVVTPPKEDFIVILDVDFARSRFLCDVYGSILHIPFDNFFRIYSPSNYEYSFIKSDGLIMMNVNGYIHRLNKKNSLHEPLVIKSKARPPSNTNINKNKNPHAEVIPPAEEKVPIEDKPSTLESNFQQRPLYIDILSHELEKEIFREYIKQ